MTPDVVQRLLALNQAFYATVAEPFVRSRSRPQPGFARLLDFVPRPCETVLDVGCGEGRYGRFMRPRLPDLRYTGVDFSSGLLDHARATTDGVFVARNLAEPDCLAGMGVFDLVVSLATLHHIPGRAQRQALFAQMAACVRPHGRLFVSTWQFLESDRQRRKVRPWSDIGLAETDVEPGDCLLSWQRGTEALRYVRQIGLDEIATLAGAAGLAVVDRFRSDGREGNLSLYVVLAPQ